MLSVFSMYNCRQISCKPFHGGSNHASASLTSRRYSNTRNTLVILEKVENQNLTRGSSQLAAIQKHQNSVQVVDMLSTATINAQDIVATTSDLFQAQSWRTISSTTKVISWEKYHCGIGLISVSTEKKRRTQQNGNGLQFVTQTVSTKCRISPRFLSWSLEFMVSRWNQWTPTFGLTIEHQISWEVYEQRLRPLFESDDVPALQELLCRGECNLDSLIQDSWSLVEVSTTVNHGPSVADIDPSFSRKRKTMEHAILCYFLLCKAAKSSLRLPGVRKLSQSLILLVLS